MNAASICSLISTFIILPLVRIHIHHQKKIAAKIASVTNKQAFYMPRFLLQACFEILNTRLNKGPFTLAILVAIFFF
jgi:hypothetical protein